MGSVDKTQEQNVDLQNADSVVVDDEGSMLSSPKNEEEKHCDDGCYNEVKFDDTQMKEDKVFNEQIHMLEKINHQQKLALDNLQIMLNEKNKELECSKQELNSKILKLTQQSEQSSKELEAMVMKYAVSENTVINVQRLLKQTENKIKDCQKDRDAMEAKYKQSLAEKNKLHAVIESKNAEILNLERDVNKRKDEINAQASNLKFFQNKLKLEMESHRETQGKLEKMSQKVREAKEETDQVRRDSQEMLRKYDEAGKQDAVLQAMKQLEQENNDLCIKVQSLETERLEMEQKLSRVREANLVQEQYRVDLEAAKAQLEANRLLLQQEQSEAARQKQCNAELMQDITDCRKREAELLGFTQKLTEKNVSVQSELSAIRAKAHHIELDHQLCQSKIEQLQEALDSIREELANERQQYQKETEELRTLLLESTENAKRLASQLEDVIGENILLKKKHQTSIKELTKELQVHCKRGESSRTSSNLSLNSQEASDSAPELDKQLLIQKIDKVQRADARKQEKLDFLEEHTQQLVQELQRKSRLIQSLILQQQVGAVAPDFMDSNKAALTKHRSIMASVYSSKPADDAMTLELSLQINQKLQAVLEDTLLKNITLKENMETLGDEIARLSSNQRR